MPTEPGFTDSDIMNYRHEAERHTSKEPPQKPKADVGRKQRGAPNPRDAILSDLARVWIDTLPSHLRPRALCQHYPRIANRLALCWPDSVLTAKVFASVLEDRRGNRRGFRPDVSRELVALRDHSALVLDRKLLALAAQ
jgi:hypothetical protein